MIRKISIMIFAIGFTIFAYSGWQYYQVMQSVEAIPVQKQTDPPEKLSATTKNIPAKSKESLQKKEKVSTLDFPFSKGDKVAFLDIPALGKRYKIYWGTGEDTLSQGVGMYVSKWTTVPNSHSGHTVLSGHRDTVFTGLGKLEKSDILKVHFDGKTYKYVIQKTWVTKAEDRTVIVKKEKPTLTLTTCYPFDYIGDAPKRYIIQASLAD
ncbi:class D sortase [Thalassobacillus pellis]|uniref:class D sortase n=1 Tax=Thalassobacillus pellis TaxID=748008 RepID=UPI00195F746A|nr:class D sortase [Thalassobacillus pellis]MBM7553233.1 sortase A [Thalassobacillus pellis]